MKKHIKYLISLLLVFGLTVNDSSIHSQPTSPTYHQVSQLNTQKEGRQKYSKLYIYSTQLPTERLCNALILYLKLRDLYSIQVTTVLNLQNTQYQNISSIIARHVFLNKKLVSSNQFSSLYIA